MKKRWNKLSLPPKRTGNFHGCCAPREGQTYIVTSHGKAVARIVPAAEGDHLALAARANLLARLHSQKVIDIGPWTRDEWYEGFTWAGIGYESVRGYQTSSARGAFEQAFLAFGRMTYRAPKAC